MSFAHRILVALLVYLSFGFGEASAHAVGENYIFLSVKADGLTGRFEFHVKDLEDSLGLEFSEETPAAHLKGIEAQAPQVQDYIRDKFTLSAGGRELDLTFSGVGLLEEVQSYAQFHFTVPLSSLPEALDITSHLLEESGKLHRGLLVVEENQLTNQKFGPEGDVVRIFSSSNREQSWTLRETVEPLLRPLDFIWQGILHIWIGTDHILFLVVLLLPAVLRRESGAWVPEENFKLAMWKVVKIITLFTIAHSITLALAAIDVIRIPGRVVESIIAASIVMVAVNNFVPKFREGSAFVIFSFGLFHGMGFASVMGDIPFRMQDLGKILVAFNVGVEIGQLAIVVCAFGVLFSLRRVPRYQTIVLKGGSVIAGLMAAFWFVERAFDL